MVKIARVLSKNLIVSAGLNLENKIEGKFLAFERRLIRLWRIGFLLNEICNTLDISLNHLNDELIRLKKENKDLSIDSRDSSYYLKIVSEKTFKETIPENIFILKNEDYWFYKSKNISNPNIALLLEVPYHYLQQFKRYSGIYDSSIEKYNAELEKNNRNKSICNDFISNKNTLGIKTKLSKKYDVSRRAIDFILDAVGIDHKLTKSKVRFVPNEIKIKHENIVKDYLKILKDEKEKGITRIGRMSGLASKYSLSHSGIINILKQNNVYKPQKRNKKP